MLINTSSFKTICNKLVIKLEATVGPHGGKGIPRLDSYGDLLTEKVFVVLICFCFIFHRSVPCLDMQSEYIL